jgi:hypothetical protein
LLKGAFIRFAREHPRLLIVLVMVDLITLAGLSWAPFDSHPGSTPLTDFVGLLSLLVQLLGYFGALLVIAQNESIAYLVSFVVTLLQLVLISKGVILLRKKPNQE